LPTAAGPGETSNHLDFAEAILAGLQRWMQSTGLVAKLDPLIDAPMEVQVGLANNKARAFTRTMT
jgi:hypothetical protein